MGTNIENRIVEMQFDNGKFEHGVSQTISSLEKLNSSLKLGNAVSGFSGITDAASKVDVSGISAGINNINWATVAMASIVQTVFRNITDWAITTGQSIIKALTIEGAAAGFSEYELKMGAIQTMMASSGESLDVVNQKLQELNEYSDKTIYSFSDMTQNISKFTNAGMSLDKSVAAIKGVANVAAVSGANAEEASRAMYNFAQALSSGSVRLMDWKSIELANMGTVEFKNQLLETAVSVGTLEKTADGMYRVLSKNTSGGTMDQVIDATTMFNDSLSYQWMTTDVLTDTLGKYSDATTEIGAKATKAATEVKTFSQMINTVKEAIGSGWSSSFEAIFGDKEQSLQLWTSLNNAISSLIGPMADARNEMLWFWNENGGRESTIAGLTNVLSALGAILKPLGDAFREVFPAKTGEDLVGYSKAFEEFTKKLTPSAELLKNIGIVFKGIFSAISLIGKTIMFGFTAVTTFANGLFKSSERATTFTDSIKDGILSVFSFFTKLNEATSVSETFAYALNKIADIAEIVGSTVSNFITGFMDELKDFGSGVGNIFSGIWKAIEWVATGIGKVFSYLKDELNFDFSDFLTILLATITGIGVGKFVQFLKDLLKGSGTILGDLSALFGSFTGTLESIQTSINAGALKSIAISVMLLAAAMMLISLIKPEKLKGAMIAISMLLTEVMGIMALFGKIGGKSDGLTQACFALGLMSVALILLSVAVKRLGELDPETLTRGLVAIGVLLAELGLFTKLVSVDKGSVGAGIGMMLFATSLLILAKVIGTIGAMDTGNIVKAMTTLGVLFGFMIAIGKLTSPAEMAKSAGSVLVIAVAMTILAGALKLLSGMSLEQIAVGLLAMGGSLALIVATMRLIPKNIAAQAVSLLIIAGALSILANVMTTLGSMSWDQLAISLTGLGAALAIIGIFLYAVANPKMLAGAAALLIVSGALVLLATALKIIGGMSPEAIVIALVAIAAAFLIIGVAGYALTGALPGILGFAAAVFLIGAAIFVAGVGIGAFAAGIALLLTVAAAFGAALPTLASWIAKAIGSFASGLAEQGTAITNALVTLLSSVLDSILTILPKLFDIVRTILDGLLGIILEFAPKIVEGALTLLIAFLTAILNALPEVIKIAGDIIVALITGLTANIDKIATAGADFIITLIAGIGTQMLAIATAAMETVVQFINGLGTAINENGKEFDEAATNLLDALYTRVESLIGTVFDFATLGKNIADGIKEGIINAAAGVATAVGNLVRDAFDAGKEESDSHSPSRLFAKLGTWWGTGISNGLANTTSTVVKTAKSVVTAAYSAMEKAGSTAASLFEEVGSPTITPVVNLDNVLSSAKTIGSIIGGASAVTAAGAINSRLNRGSSSENTSTGATGNTSNSTTFVQNNYSPKTLNRLEIYRTTRNQLMAMKGLSG